MEKTELSLEELDEVFGALPREAAIDKALEHPELYRQEKLEELKREKDALTSAKEYIEANSNEQSRRGR